MSDTVAMSAASLPLRRWIAPALLAAIFAQGFLSMGFQLVASRLLAPVFGTTLFVWATIISTFLAAFSLGALGGGLCSRMRAGRIRAALVAIGIVGAGGFAFTAGFGRVVIEQLDAMTGEVAVSLGGACLALFLVPTAAMSCVLPIITEALIVRGTPGGLSTGVVYAVSTFGNIAGVMTTAFWLVPHLATSRILSLWAVSAAACFVAFYLVIAAVPFPDASAPCSRRR